MSRAAFELYVRLLGDKTFFFYDRCALIATIYIHCARQTDRILFKADDVRFVTSCTYPASHPRAAPRHIAFVAPEFVVPRTYLARTTRSRCRGPLCAGASTTAIYTNPAAPFPP